MMIALLFTDVMVGWCLAVIFISGDEVFASETDM